MGEQIISESGTKLREEEKPRYDLIELDFQKRLGKVLARGCKNYGFRIWQAGDATFLRDCYNHAVEHQLLALAGDSAEDHWLHSVCNQYFISWYQVNKPEIYAQAFPTHA